MARWAFLIIAVVASCTSPNPRSCKDGTCTDPAFPFCDTDGSLAGAPETCLAVACSPADVAGCRGDNAIVCNSTGSDYDLVACPHGCGTSGCNECTASDQCPTSRPVCDASGSCRTCALDDECPSRVCEAGTCVAESGVLYAASGGADTSACTLAAPCTPGRAIALARVVAVPPTVRMLPGAYPVGLIFDSPTAAPIPVVATGATIAASVALSVTNGASASVRGGTLTSAQVAVVCGVDGQPTSRLAIRKFENLTMRDYHLVATSPAVDAAILTTAFPGVSSDFEGIPRPQGPKPDLGAFERTPRSRSGNAAREVRALRDTRVLRRVAVEAREAHLLVR